MRNWDDARASTDHLSSSNNLIRRISGISHNRHTPRSPLPTPLHLLSDHRNNTTIHSSSSSSNIRRIRTDHRRRICAVLLPSMPHLSSIINNSISSHYRHNSLRYSVKSIFSMKPTSLHRLPPSSPPLRRLSRPPQPSSLSAQLSTLSFPTHCPFSTKRQQQLSTPSHSSLLISRKDRRR